MPVLSEVGVSAVDPAATVREAQAGSAAAFERLYREHSARVYALCLRLAADPVQAEAA